MTSLALPQGTESAAKAADVLRVMAAGRGDGMLQGPVKRSPAYAVPEGQEREAGIVMSAGTSVIMPGAWLAAALGRRYTRTDDSADIPRLLTELGPPAAIVVAQANDLSYALLKDIAATCRNVGISWGLVTGLDEAGVAFHAWKVATAPVLSPPDLALLDLFGRRLVIGGQANVIGRTNVKRLLASPPRCLVLASHGDGTHATVKVAATQLCGVLGDIERDNSGDIVEGGCVAGHTCRRLRPGAGRPVAASLLPIDLIVHVACNGTALPGRFLPTQSSVAYAALTGHTTAFISPASYLGQDATETGQRVYDCLSSGGTLAQVAAILSDPADEWVVSPVLGDPLWKPFPVPGRPFTGKAAGQRGGNPVPADPPWRAVPARHERRAPAPAGQSERVAGLRNRLASVRVNLADLISIRQTLRGKLGVDVLPITDTLQETLAGAMSGAAVSLRTGLGEATAARALDSALATADRLLLTQASDRVLPLGQFAFDPGSPYRAACRREAGVCPQCAEIGVSIEYHAPAQGLPARVVDFCPLCGPTAIRRPSDPRPRIYSDGPVRRGQPARIIFDLTEAAPSVSATVNAYIIGREDGTVLCSRTTTLASQKVCFEFDLPALRSPDILRVCAVLCKDLSLLMARGRIAVK